MVVGDWSGTAELFLPEQGWREKAWFPIAGMMGTVCLKFSCSYERLADKEPTSAPSALTTRLTHRTNKLIPGVAGNMSGGEEKEARAEATNPAPINQSKDPSA